MSTYIYDRKTFTNLCFISISCNMSLMSILNKLHIINRHYKERDAARHHELHGPLYNQYTQSIQKRVFPFYYYHYIIENNTWLIIPWYIPRWSFFRTQSKYCECIYNNHGMYKTKHHLTPGVKIVCKWNAPVWEFWPIDNCAIVDDATGFLTLAVALSYRQNIIVWTNCAKYHAKCP